MRAPYLFLIFTLLAAAPAWVVGQKPESQPTTRGLMGIVYDDGHDTIYMIHAVEILIGDLSIRCDAAVVWLEKEETPFGESRPTTRPQPSLKAGPTNLWVDKNRRVKELYVEGTVHVRQREEVYDCERAFFDLVHERGVVVDPRIRFDIAPSKEEKPLKLLVLADELRILSEVRSELIGVKFSTCPFGNPHWHVSSEKIDFFRARAAARAESRPGEQPPPNFYYTSSNNLLYPGDSFPILWLPNLSGDSNKNRPLGPFKNAGIGKSNQFGQILRVQLGDDLETKDHKKWGSWDLFLHEYGKRGPGVGIDFRYEQKPCFFGDLKAYYQHDHGEDEFYGTPPTEERWRLSYQHRSWLAKNLQLDLEYNKFSDRGYYPTFFEREFKEEKPPETYAYLKQAFHDSAITGLLAVRSNDWDTTTEYRPKLTYDLITHPLFDLGKDPVYLTARAEVAHPRRRIDDALGIGGVSQWRVDLDTLVEYPMLIGPAKITPFAGLRSTYYQYDIAKNPDETRNGFTYGGSVATQFWRDWDVAGGLFNLDGLRHVVRPAITYRRTTGIDLHPNELQFFDDTDTFDDEDTVTFELRNVFQTVRHRKKKPAAADELMDLEMHMNWYPEQARDNGGRPFGNLIGDLILRPSDKLQLIGDWEWNPSTHQLEEYNVAIGYAPSATLQTYAGFRHFDDTYDLIYGQVNWRASEKWMFGAYMSYDFERREDVEHNFFIRRIGHDWVFSLILHADVVEDDYGFSIGIEPRALFDPIVRPVGARREPEFQYLGTELIK